MEVTETNAVARTPEGDMDVHIARPAGPGPHPGLLLFQEAFGVNDHIRDVCRRFAAEGYVVAAPSTFHRFGVDTVPYEDKASAIQLISKLTPDQIVSDASAALVLLTAEPDVDGARIGCVGFCFGGRCAFLAATLPGIKASVPFYGGGIASDAPDAPITRAADVHAELLLLFGADDESIPAEQRDRLAEELSRHGKRFESVVYDGAGHAFFNDSRPDRHHAPSAEDAWTRTLEFLRRRLGA